MIGGQGQIVSVMVVLHFLLSRSQAVKNISDPNFHLTHTKSSTGLGLSLLHTSYNDTVQPVCITKSSVNDLPLLAHSICRSAKFATYRSYSLVNLTHVDVGMEDLMLSTIYCSQSPSFNTSCSYILSPSSCQSLINIECGSCHPHIQLSANTNVTLKSPLYPILQPDMICQYDLELDKEIVADISIEIDEISLAPPQQTHSHVDGGHCVSSYLHILSGNKVDQMDSIAMLCGNSKPNKINLKWQSFVKLQLVSGSKIHASNKKGFSLRVIVSPLVNNSLRKIGIMAGAVLGVIFGLGFIVICSILYRKSKAQKRKRKPRQGVTWHSSAPLPGHTLHGERTQHITRQLHIAEEGADSGVRENLYGTMEYDAAIYRYRSIRALRSLPEAPRLESITSEPIPEEETDKTIYETFNSSTCSTDTNEARSRSQQAGVVPSVPLPSIPSRPSWTLQPPPANGQCETSPMYLCFPVREEHERDRSLQVCPQNNFSSLSNVPEESKYASASILKRKRSLDSQDAPRKSVRQSLLSITDTLRSRLIPRLSISDQSGRLSRLFSQQKEATSVDDNECLVVQENEEDGSKEDDDVFY